MKEKSVLEARERALKCAASALEKKAIDVRVLYIGHLTSIADYLVLASGTSDKQTQAIADSVKKGLKRYGKAIDVEGLKEGNWIVIDYGDVIVHIFHENLRRYYDLDDLWNRAPLVEIPEEENSRVSAA